MSLGNKLDTLRPTNTATLFAQSAVGAGGNTAAPLKLETFKPQAGFSLDNLFEGAIGTNGRLPELTGGAATGGAQGVVTQEAKPAQGKVVGSLQDVLSGKATLGPGDSGQAVKDLQKLLKLPQTGVFDQATGDKVANLKKEFKLGGDPRLVGKQTLETFQANLGGLTLGNGLTINPNHPDLKKLGTATLTPGRTGYCVETVLLKNTDPLGVKTFDGGTDADPNNPRGALVQMVQAGNWVSVPLPGSKLETIKSPAYGSVQAHVIPADKYKEMADAGKIPSGALVFQTEHGWHYSGGSSGNDLAIVRDNGKNNFNFAHSPGSLVYGSDTKSVVLMVPKGALQRTQEGN